MDKQNKSNVDELPDFPNCDGFVSKQLRIDPKEFYKFMEQNLPRWNSVPGAEQKRLKSKIREPFYL